MSRYSNLAKYRDEVYKCEGCHRTVQRKDTLLIDSKTAHRMIRLCRDCQFKYYMKDLRSSNPNIDIRLKGQDFFKNIKDGL